MYTPAFADKPLFDHDGFLCDPQQWNRALALRIAREEGMENLEHRHWVILAMLRRYYARYHSPPVMHHICHLTHLGPYCTLSLFDKGAREAWRIAGLPNPGEEAKAYM